MATRGMEIKDITKRFGATEVLRGIDLHIEPGEFMTLVGPSGCGKSTLLRIIAGFEQQTEGSVAIGERQIDHLRPKNRGVAMVFQSYALYPHMSVFDNVAMPLVMRRMSFFQRFPGIGKLIPGSRRIRRKIADEVEAVARQLEIDALLERRPNQLSGGQRQRVALGRAMVRQPDVFLMDEPLSNLDARLRVHMRAELAELHKRLGVTFLYVTHDQVEAMTMSSRIAVMIDGEIVQLGTPTEVYSDPRDLRVAQFIGSPPINVFPGTTNESGHVLLFGHALPLRVTGGNAHNLQIGIRPEDMRIVSHQDKATADGLQARIRHIENLGSEFIVHLDFDRVGAPQVVVRVAAREFTPVMEQGASEDPVLLDVPSQGIFIFDDQGVRIDPEVVAGAPKIKRVQ